MSWAYSLLDKTIRRLLIQKDCFYQWQLFFSGLFTEVLKVTLSSFQVNWQAGLKKQASFQPRQAHTQPPVHEAPQTCPL